MTNHRPGAHTAVMRSYWARRNNWNQQTSVEVLWRIVALVQQQIPISVVARAVGWDRKTVRWVASWKTDGTHFACVGGTKS